MATNKNIIESAESFIGKLKYVFGSDNIAGGSGDCSSFTEYIFNIYGYNIGGNTATQYVNTTQIQESKRQIGDLIFFKDTYNSGHIDGVSHVGIYAGNNEFIHLDNSGCRRTSLDDPYYKKHYLSTNRVRGLDVEIEDTPTAEAEDTGAGLKWWGDIVRIVVIILLIILAVVFVGTAIGLKLDVKKIATGGLLK